MRKYIPFLILSLFAVIALGQTNTNSIPTTPLPGVGGVSLSGWLLVVIPLLSPLGVATFKYFIPKLPKVLLPVLTPVLGIVIDQIAALSPGHAANPAYAAALGALGVFVRECYDQTKKLIPAQTQ